MNPFRRSALFAFATWPFAGSALAADPSGTNSNSIYSGSAAGGDLTGTYPNPTVALSGGVAIGPAGTATLGQIPGSNAATAAVAGNIGEFNFTTRASGSAQLLSTGTATSILSLNLTAGDWNVWGQVVTLVQTATVVTLIEGGISATATALPAFTTGALTELALGTGGLGGGGANVLTVGPVQILNSTNNHDFFSGKHDVFCLDGGDVW